MANDNKQKEQRPEPSKQDNGTGFGVDWSKKSEDEKTSEKRG
ncbi:hypothetical protein [Vibrio kanaloae]|nr:hypothetical protein [Vibrio kanaloae]